MQYTSKKDILAIITPIFKLPIRGNMLIKKEALVTFYAPYHKLTCITAIKSGYDGVCSIVIQEYSEDGESLANRTYYIRKPLFKQIFKFILENGKFKQDTGYYLNML